MTTRVLTFGAVLGIFASAVLAILQILDVISLRDATESLGKTLAVILVSSVSIVLMIALVRIGSRR